MDSTIPREHKFGEIVEKPTIIGPKRFVLTSLITIDPTAPIRSVSVWSPVPDGMTEMDLGRGFVGAHVEMEWGPGRG